MQARAAGTRRGASIHFRSCPRAPERACSARAQSLRSIPVLTFVGKAKSRISN